MLFQDTVFVSKTNINYHEGIWLSQKLMLACHLLNFLFDNFSRENLEKQSHT